jgi:carbon storage regulator CsrA
MEGRPMLCLKRRRQEAVNVDGPATVRILKIVGSAVVLGITAADGVQVLREELVPFERSKQKVAGEGRLDKMAG